MVSFSLSLIYVVVLYQFITTTTTIPNNVKPYSLGIFRIFFFVLLGRERRRVSEKERGGERDNIFFIFLLTINKN
mgnify:CR=1 FL=1